MKMFRTFAKITCLALVICIAFAITSCGLFSGSLELKTFVVDRSTVKTVYYVGEQIDFSGIKATVKYSDESLNTEYTYDDLVITFDDDITSTPGVKTVKVSFTDPHLGTEQFTHVQITVKEDPNAPKHSGYSIDTSAVKVNYFVGDELDFAGIKVYENFTNGGEDVEMTDLSKLVYEYANDITATPGSKNVVVLYNGENAGAITVNVKYPERTSVTPDTDELKIEYNLGETVDLSGLSALITYENGVTKTVTEFTAGTVDMTTPGGKSVIANYVDPISGAAAYLTVDIKVDGIVDYTFLTDNMNLSYHEGDTVSFDGLVVNAVYYYGSVIPVTDYILVHDDNLTATPGNKNISIKIGDEVIGSFIIAVGDVPTASVNAGSVKLSYRVGETVSLDGITLTLTYKDGTPNEVITSGFEIVTDLSALTSTAGTKTVSVKYVFDGDIDLYASVSVTVYGVDSYTIDTTDMKTEYIAGGKISYNGIRILANYKDGGAPEEVDLANVTYSLAADSVLSVSDTTVEVSLDGKVIGNIGLTVKKNTITSIVVGGDYKNAYEYGDTEDFTGLTVTVTYLDGSVVVITEGLAFSGFDTASAGTKTVTVSFTDSVNNESASTFFTITVIKRDIAASIQKPDSITAFESDNSNAGKTQPDQSGFSGEFAIGDKLYVIGDDNAFIFIPTLYITDDNGDDKELDKFFADVEIYVDNGDGYVKLERALLTGSEYVYTLGDEVIVTVDTYDGEYSFARPVDKVKISVLPSEEHYKNVENLSAVVLEAKVIDAYNVYEAWQLAVIDNANDLRDTNDYPEWNSVNWNTFKSEYGILGVNPAGVVLHNDIKVSYKDVPSSFFYKSEDEVQYRNTVTGEIKIYKESAGMNYLIDGTVLYKRTGAADFTIQGNFFTINASDFPLVASTSIFGADSDKGYGGDYSNACLFMFQTTNSNWLPDSDFTDVAEVTVENVAFIGNAGRDNWVVEKVHGDDVTSTSELVTAGGLILLKSARHANTVMNNCINNSFFISYFPDYQGNLTVNDSKCYDSYQNGAFVWSDATLTLNNTYINGTGGPVIIAMSVKEDDVYYNPTVIVNGGNIETHVSGEEIWFTAVGANALIPQIKALGSGVNDMIQAATQGAFKGNWVDENGKMNIEAILMPRGNNVEALNDGYIQGTASIDGVGIDRWYEATENHNPEWYSILTNPAFAAGAPFITAFDQDGNAHTLYLVQDGASGTFYDLSGKVLGTDASHQAIIMAFATTDKAVLHQGGLSVVFEFYH